MSTSIPPGYRRLLATYPRAWRRAHEAVVLGTLLDSDAASGRARPEPRDRIGLLVGGLLVRLPHRMHVVRAAGLPIAATDFRLFDQSNGFDPQREQSESELVKQNEVHDRSIDLEHGDTVVRGVGLGGGFLGGSGF
jgi:hypothetical protein